MKKRNRRAPVLPGAWALITDSLLLFLALISTAFGAVTAYHIEVVPELLWAGGLILTVAMVGLVNLPKYRLPAMAGVLALWGWGLWRLWKPLVWGGTRIQCDLTNTIAAKIPGVTGIAPLVELPEELWPRVTTLWVLMVGVVYALVLALLLCRLRRSLPVVLWTLLPILPALCVTEAPDSLPMAGMLTVWLTLVLTSMTDHRDPRGTARVRPVALVCVLLVLAMLAEKLPTQGTSQPLWAADIREVVINEASRGDFSALMTRWSGWMGAGSTEYMNLLGNAPAQTGRVALRVQGEQGKHYLRGYSADVYTGRRWEPMDRAAKAELEAIRETGVEPLLMLGEKAKETSVYISYSYRNGTVTTTREDGSATLKVENVAAPGGCIYYPYGLKELPENAAFGGDSHLERTGAVWEHELTYYPDWERAASYGTISYDSLGRVVTAKSGGDAYRDFVYDHELQVPEELRPMLEDWLRAATGEIMTEYSGLTFASLEDYVRYAKGYMHWREQVQQRLYDEYREALQGAYWNEALYQAMVDDVWNEVPTREDFEGVEVTEQDLDLYRDWYRNIMLSAIKGYLAQTTRYDRNTPAPPAGRDYVDWFLNESKQGYCMHYATAATLLLRTAGIPARYVSGYVAQIPWRAASAEVTDHAAHAWVEIYIDGVGWYPLEVTPGYYGDGMGDIADLEQADAQASAPPRATPSPSPTPTASQAVEDEEDDDDEDDTTPSAAPTPSQAPAAQTGPGVGGEGGSLSPAVWYGLGLLLLAALVVWGRRYLLDRRRKKLRGEDTNAAVRYAYACRQTLKPWGGQESEELTALAEKARFSQHILTEAERDRGADLFWEEARRIYKALPGWKKPFFTLIFGKE